MNPEVASRRLIAATTNPGKIREIRISLCALHGWSIEPLPEGLPGIEETGATFMENAVLKAIHYSRFFEGLALADDSGLCVKALGNRPGVWSARLGATAEERNHRVLSELESIAGASGTPSRDAAFHCAFAAARAGEVIWSTEAQLAGLIGLEPAGDAGFGFDPIFFVPELRKTLAQMSMEEKNRISARGQALEELRRFLTLM